LVVDGGNVTVDLERTGSEDVKWVEVTWGAAYELPSHVTGSNFSTK
jgi:hypothetical protein